MATDKSEPRVGLIFKLGLFAILTLAVIRGALSTYFNLAVEGERLRKFGEIRPEALMSLRASEKERLSSGAMPIDKAMDQLAQKGRKSVGPNLMPTSSRDVAPLQGWTKMPVDVPPAMMVPPADPQNSASADAGPAPARAGAAPGSPSDAGVKKGKP